MSSSLGIVADVGAILRAPFAPALRREARRGNVACADLAPLDLVGPKELRAAPALQGRGELPGKVDRIADAGIHAEAAGRDHEVRGVARDEHAPLAVALRKLCSPSAT